MKHYVLCAFAAALFVSPVLAAHAAPGGYLQLADNDKKKERHKDQNGGQANGGGGHQTTVQDVFGGHTKPNKDTGNNNHDGGNHHADNNSGGHNDNWQNDNHHDRNNHDRNNHDANNNGGGHDWGNNNSNNGKHHDRNGGSNWAGNNNHWNNNNNNWNNNGHAKNRRYSWHSYRQGHRPSEWARWNHSFDRAFWQRNFRAEHRYRWAVYERPHGWYYRRWAYGERLPYAFWTNRYWVNSYWDFGLDDPPYGYVWVRYGDDAMLVDVEDGTILRVVYDLYY